MAEQGLLVAIKLAKVWGVTPDEVMRVRADRVIGALAYEKFIMEYEERAIELSKEQGR